MGSSGAKNIAAAAVGVCRSARPFFGRNYRSIRTLQGKALGRAVLSAWLNPLMKERTASSADPLAIRNHTVAQGHPTFYRR